MSEPNPSTAQARVMVDELRRHGVALAVISPGSRSAALAIALDQSPHVDTVVSLDERSAGFLALGHAKAVGRPAVAVSTSGTAVANYLPAVVESDSAGVPLILITADRPPELRHVGANQTIDQIGIFGRRVRWSCDMGLAESGRGHNAYWRTTVSQAVARSVGHGGRPGPVHLNVSFREPSVPVSDDGRTSAPEYIHDVQGRPGGDPWQIHDMAGSGAADLPHLESGRVLVIAGAGDYDGRALRVVARQLGWPLLATALSGARGDGSITTYHHLLVQGVPDHLAPDAVITVGQIGPSDRLSALTALDRPQVQIDRWGWWHDPSRHSRLLLQGDPVATLRHAETEPDIEWTGRWDLAEEEMRELLDEHISNGGAMTGPGMARSLTSSRWETLVVASSMPVRDVDAHMTRSGEVLSNRGASGIDGFVSTALGVATVRSKTLALAGDLSLLHDASGFLTEIPRGPVFLVIDNHGGGLFDLLPQAAHAPGFERLFITPHGRDLTALAGFHGLPHRSVEGAGEAVQAVDDALGAGETSIVVARVDREVDMKLRRALDEAARGIVNRVR